MARCSHENVRDLTPTLGYILTDYDDEYDKILLNVAYYGYTNSDGQWYILRISELNETPLADEGTWVEIYRYTKGDSDYPTNWTNRHTLTYDYYDVVF